MSGWYVSREHELVGPLSDAEFKDRAGRGVLSRDDYAWRDGMELWVQVKDLPGMPSIARPLPPVTPGSASFPDRPPATVQPKKPKQSSKQSSKQRRNEAIAKSPSHWERPAEATGRPGSSGYGMPKLDFPKVPWPPKTSNDELGHAIKQAFDFLSKVPPIVLALIVAGIIVPPMIVPLWIAAAVMYMKSKG